jgi:site-specific DNA recombinase
MLSIAFSSAALPCGLLEMARNAQRLFAQEAPLQKRRLLNFVLSNCTWSGGELRATFRQPFDLLAETTALEVQVDKNQGRILSDRSGWLGN